MNEDADLVYSAFQATIDIPIEQIDEVGKSILIPSFLPNTINAICEASKIKFRDDNSTLINIDLPIFIVGDLHGSLHDLIRILIKNGKPPQTRYLFLGDYVDRGHFSTEVILLILSMFLLFPESIFLIRGNHEFHDIASSYGFKKELEMIFPEDKNIFMNFVDTFSYIPLAAVVGHSFLCIHGGLSPHFHDLNQLAEITRPINDFTNPLIKHILWSDPSSTFPVFNESNRGVGVSFGYLATSNFLAENHLKLIIRGHECVKGGVEYSLNDQVVTVFSSSNYQIGTPNLSGVLKITDDGKLHKSVFPPIEKMKRGDASFYLMTNYAFNPGIFSGRNNNNDCNLNNNNNNNNNNRNIGVAAVYSERVERKKKGSSCAMKLGSITQVSGQQIALMKGGLMAIQPSAAALRRKGSYLFKTRMPIPGMSADKVTESLVRIPVSGSSRARHQSFSDADRENFDLSMVSCSQD